MLVKPLLYGIAIALVSSTLGCGGAATLLKNSDMIVHLLRTDGTQDLTQYEVYLTKNADTTLNIADSEDFSSTLNHASWTDGYSATRTATELRINFRTRSDQPPYFIFIKVPNTGAIFETLKLKVDVDGVAGHESTYDLPINQTTRLGNTEIGRNDATY